MPLVSNSARFAQRRPARHGDSPFASQRHIHPRHPGFAVIRPLVLRPHAVAVVADHRRAAVPVAAHHLSPQPRPRSILHAELFRSSVAFAVEEMCSIVATVRVETNDLDSVHLGLTNGAVPAMDHEEIAWQPFVFVARPYRLSG